MERFAGRYLLLRPLGRGGMGTVHLALDLAGGTECALKTLRPGVTGATPEALQREFELLARVRHPAVVAVHDLGVTPDGTVYYTMEYVPGQPVDRALRAGDWRTVVLVAAEVTHALEALHAAGVVHGDLKPANLLVVPGAEPDGPPAGVRLLDFGLAALLGLQGEGHRGTAGYAAPEVVRGGAPNVSTDLYGVGATLFALIAGRPAFPANASTSTLRRQQSGPPAAVPLEEAGAPPALVRLILRTMAPDPGERPRHVREVRDELEHIVPAARRALASRLSAERVLGRERELARLERWLARRPQGPAVCLIEGAGGVGKTLLLGELAVRASLAGWRVVRCSGAAEPGADSLARALLQRLASATGEDAPAAGAESALDAEALEPALGALARALRERRVRALVLIDDLERLAPAALALLRRAALEAGGLLSWVWCGRHEGVDAGLSLVVEGGGAESLALGPLDQAALERLAAARLHAPVPRVLARALWARSAGHPGLAVEFLRAAAERGALAESEGGLLVDEALLDALPATAAFEDSLLERLAARPAGERDVAAALAILDRPAEANELESLAGAGAADALAALRGAGFAERDPASAWRLRPAALARALAAQLPEERRVALHRRALARPGLAALERWRHLRACGDAPDALAAAAEALAAGADAEVAVQAAALAQTAAPADEAHWRERAGRALLDDGRHRAACEQLERALQLAAPGRARATCGHLLSSAYLRAARPDELAALITRLLAEDPPAELRALLLVNESARLTLVGAHAAALPVAREALALAERAGDAGAVGYAALTLGSLLEQAGEPGEGEALAQRAIASFRAAGNRAGAVRAQCVLAMIAVQRGEAEAAEALYRAALAEARELGLRQPREELLANLAGLLTSAGRWSEAADALLEGLRLALEDGRARSVALANANLAWLDATAGRPASALRRGRRAVRLARRYAPRAEAFALRALAAALRVSGRARAAERAVRRALVFANARPEQRAWDHIEYARGCACAGRWSEAGEVAAHALSAPGSIPAQAVAILATFAGRAALRRGDPARAEERLAAARAVLGGQRLPYAGAHVAQLGAELALVRGDHAQGEAGARAVLEALAALPAPAERAHAALDFARLGMGAGAALAATVSEWLRLAASGCERLGDHRGRERALALAVDWLDRTSLPAPAAGHDRDLLQSVSRLIDSLSDFGVLTRRAMHMVVDHLGAERGVLLLTSEANGELVPVVEHGSLDAATRDRALGYSRRVVERVALSGGSLLVSDAPTDPAVLSESVVGLRLRSIVCVPMALGGRVIGAVYLDDSRRAGAFNAADRGLLEGFAHLMAVAIEKSRGDEEVRRANEQLVGENLSLRREARTRFQPQNVVGSSSAMQKVMAIVERAARSTATVLVTGENGTGKELIARTLHHSGSRHRGPFVPVNCGAIPATLIESELFGILANVATGVRAREGRFVQANGGTLFLDEIGDMPLAQQVALLSVLANREITPVGGGPTIPIDVRVVAATNRDLRQMVEAGSFREDLFFRLHVIPIEVPPLREHKADIPALARHFAEDFARQLERPSPVLSHELIAVLMQSDWPGNVRELQNYVERLIAMTPESTLVPNVLPRDLEASQPRLRVGRGRSLGDVVGDLERRLVLEALERCGGNQSETARQLGMTEQSLRYRLRKYAATGDRRNRRSRRNRRK